MDMKVGNVALLDRHEQSVGGRVHREAMAGHESVAPQGQKTFSGVEGRLDENLRRIARRVVLAVRYELQFFAVQISAGRARAARHPAGQFGLATPSGAVDNCGGDPVFSANFCIKRAGSKGLCGVVLAGRGGCFHSASLCIGLDLAPHVVTIFPVEQGGSYDRLLPLDGVSIDIGDDDIDGQGLALVDEIAGSANADVSVSRMEQETGAAAPGLAIDVEDGGCCVDVGREGAHLMGAACGGGGICGFVAEVDSQDVPAGGVGA